MSENNDTKMEKLTLKYCDECGTKTIHISKKTINEIENVSNIVHRCLICDNTTRKTINHNREYTIQTPKNTPCYNCGNIIRGKGHTVNDTLGMSGDIYHVCDRRCADELIGNL